jgi:hypothetical protein
MNKSTIFIGLGVLAVSGLAFWYLRKPSSDSQMLPDMGKSAVPPMDEAGLYDTGTPIVGAGNPKSRKQTRRDCKAEAKSQGLRGRAKRQFKRECKAAGGINADTADFAFNGYDGTFDFA